ncbi:MAG: hypothetical protein CBC35_00695 [Planctomycetes bacterium TMED75]|nr:hypothetical protein [Planctomycetaceae bacterium]OUU96682.1 MAG: hypothetical protein CBC35_00695 [Planctomycetes bacterium TMED75]
MITKFRRLFARKAPLELEVYRRSQPGQETPESAPESPEIAPKTEPSPDIDPPAVPPVSEAEDRLIRQIARIEPLADTMIKRLERLGASEQELAALVETFTTHSANRDHALQETVQSMAVSSDRQNQLLGALRDQLDQADATHRELSDELRHFGADLKEITAQQQASTRQGSELVTALREHTEQFTEQMKVLAGVGIGLIIVAALVLVAGIVLLVLGS